MEEQQLPVWLQRILKQRDRIFYGALALVVVLVVSYRFTNSRSYKRQGDYAKAAHACEQILAGAKETGSLGDLQQALKKHADLRSRYDGAVAQSLLDQERVAEAAPYAKRALERTESRTGDYHQFATCSLLISEGHLEEALTQSISLQGHLDQGKTHLLWAYNTVRIAMLEEELGKQAEAKEQWSQLISWIDAQAPAGSSERGAVQQFLQAFHTGDLSIRDFAKARLHD